MSTRILSRRRASDDFRELSAAERIRRDGIFRADVVRALLHVQEMLHESHLNRAGSCSPVRPPIRGGDFAEEHRAARALVEQIGRRPSPNGKVTRQHDHGLASSGLKTALRDRRDVEVEAGGHLLIKIGERAVPHRHGDRHVRRARVRLVRKVHEVDGQDERCDHAYASMSTLSAPLVAASPNVSYASMMFASLKWCVMRRLGSIFCARTTLRSIAVLTVSTSRVVMLMLRSQRRSRWSETGFPCTPMLAMCPPGATRCSHSSNVEGIPTASMTVSTPSL